MITFVSFIGYIAFFLFGTSIGSFICCVAYRLPRNINIIQKRSFCNICKQRLKVSDLFPITSYLLSRGSCKYCKIKTPISYPIIELIVGLIFTLLYHRFSLSYKSLLLVVLTICLLIATLIDIEFYIIPDSIQIVLFLVSLVYNFTFWHLLSALILFSISLGLKFLLTTLLNRDALGCGDVKFFFICGLFIEPRFIPTFLILSGTFGIITSIIWKAVYQKETFPFIPSLSASLFIITLYP